MMLDTVLRGARIAGADADAPLVDIGIAGGTIAAVEPSIRSDADCVDLGGKLVSPGLVETHIHLDKSRIVDRCASAAGRARDHMERVSAVKPGFTVEDVYARAAATLEQCILNGTTHVRTHVEVDPNVGLRSFEALRQLAADYAWAVDLELCVFAQEGWTNVPETDRNVVAALDRGASVVGGAPGYDPDAAGQIRRIFELALEFDRDVDIHLDVGPSADAIHRLQARAADLQPCPARAPSTLIRSASGGVFPVPWPGFSPPFTPGRSRGGSCRTDPCSPPSRSSRRT